MRKYFVVRNLLINLFVFGFLQFTFSNCKDDLVDSVSSNIHDNIVISSKNHLAFPDLISHDNIWYLTYRESDAHVFGTFSKIKVLKSIDFIHWTKINNFEFPIYDLRDPKFSFNEQDNKLYLHIHAANTIGQYGATRKNFIVDFDEKKLAFTGDSLKNIISMPEKTNNDWLWRPTWKNGQMYVGGYSKGKLRFYKYKDLNKTPLIFSHLEGNSPTETTLSMTTDSTYFIVRKGNEASFGIANTSEIMNFDSLSSLVNIDWRSLPFPELGGPNMVIYDNKAYIGGRMPNTKTAIITYSITNNKIEKVDELYSFGDNSYPGMIIKDGILFGIYYTQSENSQTFQIRTFTYSFYNSNE